MFQVESKYETEFCYDDYDCYGERRSRLRNKRYTVYNVKNGSEGCVFFLIFDGEWVYVNADGFTPVEEE